MATSKVDTTPSITGVPRSYETAAPPRTVVGPYAQAYCRVLGGGIRHERGILVPSPPFPGDREGVSE